MQPIRLGIVGLGKIALEEHVPALRANAAFQLAAGVSTTNRLEQLPCYGSVRDMLERETGIDAVAICTPTQVHYDAAKIALEHGKHVLLEKPPCSRVEQFDELVELALTKGCTLFQTWHARETAAVDAAARWLNGREVRRGRVVWKEDVRQWHPKQTWIWQEGGFGVLDAGINAISILTKILPEHIIVESAHILTPENCQSPIAAAVVFRTESGAFIDAEFDFRHQGTQSRSIDLDTDAGVLNIARHGFELGIDGAPVNLGSQEQEYASLYRRFADLIANRRSDTDKRPLELVIDILQLAGHAMVGPFRE